MKIEMINCEIRVGRIKIIDEDINASVEYDAGCCPFAGCA